MHGDTYTPEGSSSSSSSTPSRSRSGSPHRSSKNGVINGSTNGESKASTKSPVLRNTSNPLHNNITNDLFHGHEREQVARILIQGLQDLGYGNAAQALTRESGYELESNSATAFREAILSGNWTDAEALLPNRRRSSGAHTAQQNGHSITNGSASKRNSSKLQLREEADQDEMLFLIRQQKYLELLEQGNASAALVCLRQELHALHQDQRQLHALSSLIMCQSPEEVKQQAAWDGAEGTSRMTLLSNLARSISPSIMLRDHRLARLLDQWKDSQIHDCVYHNDPEPPSLYVDHECSRDDVPLEPVIELDHHTHEVWYVMFSNDGTRVATAGQDHTIAIYDTSDFNLEHLFAEHRGGVAAVAWSPDDKTLISCSQDKEARLWDVASGRCFKVLKKHDAPITCAAWAPDGQTFAIGSHDINKPLSIWSLRSSSSDAGPLYNFDSSSLYRVQDCAIAAIAPATSYEINPLGSQRQPEPQIRLATVCVDNKIQIYDYIRREKLRQIDTGFALTSLALTTDGQEMIVNLNCCEVWAIGVEDGLVRRKFQGQQQGQFIIRGCYGGASESFVVSGGEDGRICIWHRYSSRLLDRLDGHCPTSVNTVAWNRANPRMFASAGDDCKVRIWAAVNSELGQSMLAQDAQPSGHSNAHLGTAAERSVPQWGTDNGGVAVSGISSLMRR